MIIVLQLRNILKVLRNISKHEVKISKSQKYSQQTCNLLIRTKLVP